MSYWNKGNGVAEIGIKICDFEKHEKGYGTGLYKMLMKALFDDYNYSIIITSTNVNNLRAQLVYEKIGFRKVGINVDAWKDQLGVLQSTIDY